MGYYYKVGALNKIICLIGKDIFYGYRALDLLDSGSFRDCEDCDMYFMNDRNYPGYFAILPSYMKEVYLDEDLYSMAERFNAYIDNS